IEGGASRNFLRAKRLMVGEPETWHALLGKLAQVVGDYLLAQAQAGAQVFQRLAAAGVPLIHFGVDTANLLPLLAQAGGDVIGLDWRTPLDWGWGQLGAGRAVQGNLDPTALFAPRPELERRVRRVLAQAGGRPGHIFNLGHGILPETPVDNVRAVVEMVHE